MQRMLCGMLVVLLWGNDQEGERQEGTYKAAHFRECLSQMANSNDNASFLEYTLEWLRSTDRGGLFYINDATHILFLHIELKIQELLPNYLTQSKEESLVRSVVGDEDVQEVWRVLAIGIDGNEEADELLFDLVDMWVVCFGVDVDGGV